ncbi:3-oxoacyl-[acyl-carrier-protein] reductase [Erysipelothrix sp. HDW6C]|uniref:3-oxoacyl-[acyl-carrier-protein] reductase n=1 Tax=Erysipelothrix sp. HDW6C TaxID=2714930 RepID=UPI00140802D9|nr:3-oxoacyl-[acyl-carrier-protein] reductase [Erysipelothrix sp. HDW6C]QIK69715.1 3-oxoacyl-[acyl-carrier-protein] reductase [Erysipelothrix sp. HDW6C]
MNKPLAIVTGATKGIGHAIAMQLVEDGYEVYGTYVRDYEPETLKALESDAFTLHQVDASNQEMCKTFIQEVLNRGKNIAVLVNNAGIVKDNLLMRMPLEDFTRVLDVNLTGVFNMTQAITKPMMRQKFGAIVNITSVIGEIGNVGQANYAASKAGLIGFSKSIAKEFASRNIRVNCVAPGFIETDMTETLSDDIRATILNNIAMKSLGSAQDVANAVSFLVSDKARYITGQTLNVCGGMVM